MSIFDRTYFRNICLLSSVSVGYTEENNLRKEARNGKPLLSLSKQKNCNDSLVPQDTRRGVLKWQMDELQKSSSRFLIL